MRTLLNHQPELESCETQKTTQLKAMTRILMAMIAMLLFSSGNIKATVSQGRHL